MELGPGTMIGGRYRLEHLLGRGGMGEVWAAQHQVTRRGVALKFLNVDHGAMPQMRRRFLREARAASAVAHPNVIQIQDVFELDDETPVMVMDLLTGEALGDKLARQGALTVDETAQIMAPVVSALGTAHALGIVHRDLKPENIFLARSADGESRIEVKVLDFGIAKLAHAVELDQTGAVTGTGAVLGTPYYMALEQAYGEKDIDHRADIWSLGVVLYECLAGRRPIEGDNFGQIIKFLTHGTIPPLTEVAPHVPADISQLVARMLERAREDRPQDLREVLTVLRRYTGSIARMFGAPKPPQTSGVHEAPEGPNPRHSAPALRGFGSTGRARVDAEMATVEVISTDHPHKSERSSSPRIPTGKKVSPGAVTLAESGSVLAAPAPSSPRAEARRPALIAAAGAVVGMALTAAAVLTLARGPLVVRASGAASVRAPASTAALPVVQHDKPPLTAAPVAFATAVAPAAQPSVAPAEPTQAASADPAPSASTAPKAPKTGAHPWTKAVASSVSTAKPAASAAPTKQPKGGLVDEPPF